MDVGVLKEVKTRVNGAIVEDAPEWYDTPLDQLDFHWSHDERVEIERYCEKIHKNIAEEEMTPRERFEAMIAGKPKDRQLLSSPSGNMYLARVLSAGGDSVKAVDVIRNPKLFVKGHLAYLARFATDWPVYMIICYSGIGVFGGKAKLLVNAQPCMTDYPIKTMADLEGMESPDPKKDGMFPGYLWACREMKRIFDDYGLSKLMPMYSSMCPGVESMIMEGMMGWTPFILGLRRNEELCKRAVAMGNEFSIKLGKAIIEVSQPDALQC
ncbi:hypothetical protein ACFLXA_04050 [Chloroflexota bacterium]